MTPETQKPEAHPWCAFPSWWVWVKKLRAFRSDDRHALAALRVYLALARALGNIRRDLVRPDFRAECWLSYSQIQKATKVDRGLIKGALDLLAQEGLLEIHRSPGGRSRYTLLGDWSKGFSKIPQDLFKDKQGLAHLSPVATGCAVYERYARALDALKIYLLFLGFRDARTNRVKMVYDVIVEYTGVQRQNVRTALTILAGAGMIHIESSFQAVEDGRYRRAPNRYFIKGLAEFRSSPELVAVEAGT